MSTQERSLREEIQEVLALYPSSRSATLPALRLAQERLGETPAYCMAVASFYDMFHLEPVGRHLVEVCTNISCALVGAQQVLEAFERELGIRAGETAEDESATLRTIECAGGCGRAVVVVVDHRYREPCLLYTSPSPRD